MNHRLSPNILTSVLTVLNHIYQLDSDDVAKCQVSELNSSWCRLHQLAHQYTDNSLLSSLAVQSLAVLICHGLPSDITQSVISVWNFSHYLELIASLCQS